MEIQHFLDMMVPLATAGVAFLGVWVRKLMDEIHGLNGKLSKLHEDTQREHDAVLDAVSTLSAAVTTEVRGIVQQHSEHDKQNTRIEVKIDQIKENVNGLSGKTCGTRAKASNCKCSH